MDVALKRGAIETSGTSGAVWTGRVLSGLAIAFLAFDGLCKVVQAPFVMEASAKMGFPLGAIFWLGVILTASVVLYSIPRTAPLGAVLLTGYLGGAVATHVKLGDPLFSHTLFPVYFGILVWLGLFLRDARVRALVQPRD